MSMNPPALSSVSPPSGLPPHPLDAEWFIHQDAHTYGPYTGRTIRDFVAEGRVTLETVVARVGVFRSVPVRMAWMPPAS